MAKPKAGSKKVAPKSSTYVGYGTDVSAGKNITKQVKKTVRKGVVSAAKKAGRKAAKGTGSPNFSKKQMENFGRGGKYLVKRGVSKTVATNTARDRIAGNRVPQGAVTPRDPLMKVMEPVFRAVSAANKALTGKGIGPKTKYLQTSGSRSIATTNNGKTLYERKANKAYWATKKRMASKGKKNK